MTDPNHIAEARKKVSRPQIREVFLRNGFTIKPDRDDLRDYVYEAALELLEMAAPAVQGEPVLYVAKDAIEDSEVVGMHAVRRPNGLHNFPLYTVPQPTEQQPDVTQLVEALEQIERWGGFPSTDKTWEGSGEPVSYGAAFGSNGERDFMREVARKALAAMEKTK